MERYRLYIDGKSCEPEGGQWFPSESPFTGEPWAEVARGNAADVERAVSAAHRAFVSGAWPELSASARGLLLHRFADRIAAEASRLAATEVRDNGKLYAEMHAQLSYLPQWFRYYGGLADKVQGDVIPLDKKGYFNYTRQEPLGVVAIITPWNSPLMLLAWKLAPALAAGCTVVIKPSEFTSASTLELVQLLDEVGFPQGVVNVVTGFGNEVGSALVGHPLVRKVTFTGADTTGRRINEHAARDLKHVSLELGGKSPNIVFDDAILDDAVNGAVAGIFAATGQTCIAGSRLLVQNGVYDEVVSRVVQLARTARMGDPMEAGTQVGPITTRPQYEKVLNYIQIARSEGATLALGGKPAARAECGTGWFIEPTIFTDVDNRMRIAQEEVFGPVLSVIRFEDEEQAIDIANDVRFGLGAGVWTSDIGRAFRMAERLQSGTVWVNTYRAVSYMSPFGGYKDSGLGRENGAHAINDYLQTKSVWINTGAPTGNPFVIR
ncbi:MULTISPECIES: aldehyde dehydrogenase [Paraburkholderia]|uniref:aldehyde dehydrogenase n=1 Tax=Paraburkholderia TaxID=1822464 RepID=UPI0006B4AA30|nr:MULTISPECIES: aldehyde dehydrogenase [Paraburkholderia]KPD14872.1 carnitine dehydratase [Burkholderia sp. ST111]MBK5153394.1 aldehyde dehydrogenase [Burkholderia sp. R-69608]MBK5186003.1 aldehyde dehydrogenase [Burkholderia sp. R-69749]CAE6898215.1 (Z)-2-((N-methylformamido)methylene)-5-hydroxybutyrolactone dehydrogenase [Paraburkholderia domus]CAE6971881.1 (Z)-2-((N-methylformamido)methylene)-5-hydroxybutyrolactone dehydrogenase [Paraburkholderia nemoris]